MPKPNFFIVGAPKSGTTALSDYLRDHANIFVCNPKEPHYFANDLPGRQSVRTLNDYIHLFDNANANHIAIGEASVWYLYSDVALQNIKIFDSSAKIIAMLRNPVNLVHSFHSQLLYNKTEDQQDFSRAWELINERKHGKYIPKHCADIKLLYYNEIAKLGDQIERLYNIFPSEQIKIIFFEEFSSNTVKVYKEVLQFLDVPMDERNHFPVINQNKQHKMQWLASFVKHPPRSLVKATLKAKEFIGLERLGLIDSLEKLNRNIVRREALSPSVLSQVSQEYRHDIDKLSQITGKDLSSWKL